MVIELLNDHVAAPEPVFTTPRPRPPLGIDFLIQTRTSATSRRKSISLTFAVRERAFRPRKLHRSFSSPLSSRVTTEYDGSLNQMLQNGTKGPGPTVPDWQLDGHADDRRCSFLYEQPRLAYGLDRHAAPPLPVACPRLKDDGNRRRRSCLCLAVANSLRTTRVSSFVIQFYFELYLGAR